MAAKIMTTVTYTRPSEDVPFYISSDTATYEIVRLNETGEITRSRGLSGVHPDNPLKVSFVTVFNSQSARDAFQENQIILDEARIRDAYNEENGITREIVTKEYDDEEEDPAEEDDELDQLYEQDPKYNK